MYTMYKVIIISLVAFFLILCNCSKKETTVVVIDKKISEFKCPIFPGAYNVSVSKQNPPGTKAFSYTVKIEYPAQEVVDFYDNIFKPPQWVPFAEDDFGNRKWFKYMDSTIPGSPGVNRFLSSWVDPKKEVRLVIALIYFSTVDKHELKVTCQIYPFFDLRSSENMETKKPEATNER